VDERSPTREFPPQLFDRVREFRSPEGFAEPRQVGRNAFESTYAVTMSTMTSGNRAPILVGSSTLDMSGIK